MSNQRVIFTEEDPYITYERDVKVPLGLSVEQAVRQIPRINISRTYESINDTEQVDRKRLKDEILCPGAACGISADGLVRHFFPDRDLSWLGFLIALGDNGVVCVRTRGSVILHLPGAVRGQRVFCSGPDKFSLIETKGSVEIGLVRHISEAVKAAVAFKRAGDSRPLNLDVSRF